jgi:membrane associated rhomboid family serine protease
VTADFKRNFCETNIAWLSNIFLTDFRMSFVGLSDIGLPPESGIRYILRTVFGFQAIIFCLLHLCCVVFLNLHSSQRGTNPSMTLVRDNPRNLFRSKVSLLVLPLLLMWAIECVNFLAAGALDEFGIVPRSVKGLNGILFAPFLHASFTHLAANTLPYLTLGWIIILRRTRDFIWVSVIAALIAGLGTWVVAPGNSVHVGASGVIFGYLGFLLSRGYFERSLSSILLSVIIGLVYGSLLWGILPGQSGISWQGHLFGFLGGIVAARLLARNQLADPAQR